MKKIILLFLLIPLRVSAPVFTSGFIAEQSPINPYDRIWEAVKIIESGNNAYQINFDECAFGVGQIRQCKLDDFDKVMGKDYTLRDMFDKEKSKEVFMWHCSQYGIDVEDAIRAWNGSGRMTLQYWNRILKQL